MTWLRYSPLTRYLGANRRTLLSQRRRLLESTPNDTLALIATEPEHCIDCFRLICPGETYHLGKDGTILCPNCVSNLLSGEDLHRSHATERVEVAWVDVNEVLATSGATSNGDAPYE